MRMFVIDPNATASRREPLEALLKSAFLTESFRSPWLSRCLARAIRSFP